MEPIYFDCACGDLNHLFRFVLDPADGEVWLEARLNPYLPWYHRTKEAFLYVFGLRSKRTQYDVTVVRHEDIERLRLLAERVKQVRVECAVAAALRTAREKLVAEESR